MACHCWHRAWGWRSQAPALVCSPSPSAPWLPPAIATRKRTSYSHQHFALHGDSKNSSCLEQVLRAILLALQLGLRHALAPTRHTAPGSGFSTPAQERRTSRTAAILSYLTSASAAATSALCEDTTATPSVGSRRHSPPAVCLCTCVPPRVLPFYDDISHTHQSVSGHSDLYAHAVLCTPGQAHTKQAGCRQGNPVPRHPYATMACPGQLRAVQAMAELS